MKRTTCILVCLAPMALLGCTDRSSWHESSDSSDKRQKEDTSKLPKPEATLDQQIEAVRSGHSDAIYVERTEVSDDDLARLSGLAGLRLLNIENGRVSDAGLVHLETLPDLEQLKLGRCAIGDTGLKNLARIKSLRVLNLPHAVFSNDGLVYLRELPKLELLRFGSPHVTDAGLAEMQKFPSLRFLHLIDVPITDDGLMHVAAMDRLQSFYLDGSEATDDGISELLTARRDLHFHRNQRHHDLDPRKDDHRH